MSRAASLLALVAAALLLATAGAGRAELDRESLRQGSLTITYVAVAPGAGRVRIASPLRPASYASGGKTAPQPGAVLPDMARERTVFALLSGGYLREFEPPQSLGYLRVGGEQLSARHDSWLTSATFCTSGTRWTIQAGFPAGRVTGFDDCLQGGPLLVSGGQSRYRDLARIDAAERRLAGTRQIQPFLCLRRDGALVAGLAGQSTPAQLADALAGAMGCSEAMRLSGAVTAGMWFREGGLIGNAKVRLTNAIALLD